MVGGEESVNGGRNVMVDDGETRCIWSRSAVCEMECDDVRPSDNVGGIIHDVSSVLSRSFDSTGEEGRSPNSCPTQHKTSAT